jgi:hypothetical protein
LSALKDNISKFEAVNGPIKVEGGATAPFPMNFGGPTAQA